MDYIVNLVKRVFRSFGHALDGFTETKNNELNFKIHLVISGLVMIASIFFRITRYEWMLVIFLIGLVLSLELMNTAIERLVDLMSPTYHPLAKHAKDIAATAVMLGAITAVVIGAILFLPYIMNLFI